MSTQVATLARCIDQLAELTEDFHRLLQRELQALSAWPIEGLNELAREKIALAQRIHEAEAARVTCLLDANQPDTSQAGMAQLLGTSAAGRQVLQRWETVLDRIRTCQAANLAVGASLQAQTHHTVRTLELLGSQRGITVTYGRDGMSRTGRSSQHIGEA